MTYGEFAQESRLSISGVRKFVREGTLRAVRIGRAIRIPKSELDRLSKQADGQDSH